MEETVFLLVKYTSIAACVVALALAALYFFVEGNAFKQAVLKFGVAAFVLAAGCGFWLSKFEQQPGMPQEVESMIEESFSGDS